MLFGKQRRGAEHHHLLAVHRCHERGAQRHLGLSKPHVAAHQSVHGAGLAHVFDHRRDRRRLIGRLFKGEPFAERFVVRRVAHEGVALSGFPEGVEVQKLSRRVAHLLRGLLLGFLPVAATEGVQGGVFGVRPGVAADEVQLRNGHKELRVARVVDSHEFARAFVAFDGFKPDVAAHAVIEMHDGVPWL